jgi:hypothetical protein
MVMLMFAKPSMTPIEFMMPVALKRSVAVMVVFVKMLLVSLDFVPVVNRPVIGTATVMFHFDTLVGSGITVPVFAAVGPGGAGEYKNQCRNHHTGYQKFRFHCFTSLVRICLFRRSTAKNGLQFF